MNLKKVTSDEYNMYTIVKEMTTNDSYCRVGCLLTPGCSAYYVVGTNENKRNNKCKMIMGQSTACSTNCDEFIDFGSVVDSGRLSYHCPNRDVFASSFVKRSTVYCEFLTQSEEDDFVERLLRENDLSTSTALGEWTFSGSYDTYGSAKKSQLVQIVKNHPEGENTDSDSALVWIQFIFETHTRQRNGDRRRREAAEFLTSLDTDLISSTLNNLNVPQGAEVVRTTEVEVLEISEVTVEGEVAANCSSKSFGFYLTQRK